MILQMITMLMFGISMGVICGAFGLRFAEQPLLYSAINIPVILTMAGIVTMINRR